MEIAVIITIVALALAVVLYPLVIRSNQKRFAAYSKEVLDEQVTRYRAALRRATLCDHCLAANPPESRFCADCGRPL